MIIFTKSSIRTAAIIIGMALISASVSAQTPIATYASQGVNAVTSEPGGWSCTIYRPANLRGNHPVILWGNGTGASPSAYAAGLRHLASWGFVVAAANTTNAGTGEDMLDCLAWLKSSSLRGSLNLNRVGTSGHSQGGGGAIMAGRDPQITATAPIQPYVLGLGHRSSSQTEQNGPMLLLAGSGDTIASPRLNQDPVFLRANVPVFYLTRVGASHFAPTYNFGDFRGPVTAWFMYQLADDQQAAKHFTGSNCGLCNALGWRVERKGF